MEFIESGKNEIEERSRYARDFRKDEKSRKSGAKNNGICLLRYFVFTHDSGDNVYNGAFALKGADMKEAFEKIKNRLANEKIQWLNFVMTNEMYVDAKIYAYDKAIEIVNQVAEEYKDKYVSIGAYKQVAWERDIAIEQLHDLGYEFGQKIESNDGWIPCSSGEMPDTNEAVNITWVNRKPPSYYADIKDKPFTATGHYQNQNGRWYWYSCVCKDYLDEYGDSIGDRMDGDIEVIAWQPLTAPYQPKGESNGQTENN